MKGLSKYVLLGVVIICIIFFIWFFISSQTPEKLEIKPLPPKEGEVVSKEHVDWVVKELNVSKLHPLEKEKPEVEILIENSFNEIFTVIIENNIPTITPGEAINPDLRIIAKREVVIRLLTTNNLNQEVINLYDEGKVRIELLKNETILIAKGYKEIYDAIYG